MGIENALFTGGRVKARWPQSVSVAVFLSVADGIPATVRLREKKRGKPDSFRVGRFRGAGG